MYGPCSACGDGDTAQRYHKHYGPRAVPSSPSYTLGELRSSMEEFLNDMKTRGHATVFGSDSLTDWKFETYLQWLAKREQGKGEV